MNINLDELRAELDAFCGRWNIAEASLFGSVLHADFPPDSDVDILIEFAIGVRYSVMDLAVMQDELETLFGRRVDLVEKAAIKNPFRLSSILKSRKAVYVA